MAKAPFRRQEFPRKLAVTPLRASHRLTRREWLAAPATTEAAAALALAGCAIDGKA